MLPIVEVEKIARSDVSTDSEASGGNSTWVDEYNCRGQGLLRCTNVAVWSTEIPDLWHETCHAMEPWGQLHGAQICDKNYPCLKTHSTLASCGCENWRMATTCSGSSLTFWAVTWWPRKSMTSTPKVHFVMLATILWSASLWKSRCRWHWCSLARMSSMKQK